MSAKALPQKFRKVGTTEPADGHSNILKMLLQAGADIQAKNQRGTTALMFACRNGPSNVVEMLLQ
eukprot:gene17165-5311_t